VGADMEAGVEVVIGTETEVGLVVHVEVVVEVGVGEVVGLEADVGVDTGVGVELRVGVEAIGYMRLVVCMKVIVGVFSTSWLLRHLCTLDFLALLVGRSIVPCIEGPKYGKYFATDRGPSMSLCLSRSMASDFLRVPGNHSIMREKSI
jgi:hypothetical protein